MSTLRVLTSSHIDALLPLIPPPALLASQSNVFLALSASPSATSSPTTPPPVQTPQRISTTSRQSTTLYMPSYTASSGTACKIVSIPSATGGGGAAEGIPGSTVVLDEAGRVRGLVNARKLTALRNACGSALFLQVVPPAARPNLVIFGSGAQSLAHALLFLRLFPSLTSLTFVARSSNPRSTALLSAVQEAFPRISTSLIFSSPSSSASSPNTTISNPTTTPSAPTSASSPSSKAGEVEQAVRSAGIIVTCTPSRAALFPSSWVSPATQIIMIGSYTPQMREVGDDLIRRAGVVIVDSREACLQEAGELISAQVDAAEGMLELGEVLGDEGKRQRVGQGGDVMLFKSVGVGAQDVAIARVVLDEAERRGVGTVIEDYD